MRSIAMLLVAVVLSGCHGLVPPPPEGTQSFGRTNRGLLRNGVRMAKQGEGFISARPYDPTRFGTPSMVGSLERALSEVQRAFPGSPPMRVGDIAWPTGGNHPRHGSHRSGRDVDVIFFALDAARNPTQGSGWLAFDRYGVATQSRRETTGPLYYFDDARNWHFVRTLLLDEEARVQWMFCSRGIKARLLAWARDHESDPAVIARAAWVLHQPRRARSHDDHFHIRVACSPAELASGCINRAPIWPWIRDVTKPALGEGAETDELLLSALLSDNGEPVWPEAFPDLGEDVVSALP